MVMRFRHFELKYKRYSVFYIINPWPGRNI